MNIVQVLDVCTVIHLNINYYPVNCGGHFSFKKLCKRFQRNPLELLRKVKAVKEEYKALVQEAAEIEKAQSVSMNTFQLEVTSWVIVTLTHSVVLDY